MTPWRGAVIWLLLYNEIVWSCFSIFLLGAVVATLIIPLSSREIPTPPPLPLYAFLLTTTVVVWWRGMKRDKECKLFSVSGLFYLKSLRLLQVFWGSFCFSFYYGYKTLVHFFFTRRRFHHWSSGEGLEHSQLCMAFVVPFCLVFSHLGLSQGPSFPNRSWKGEGGYSFFFSGLFRVSSLFALFAIRLLFLYLLSILKFHNLTCFIWRPLRCMCTLIFFSFLFSLWGVAYFFPKFPLFASLPQVCTLGGFFHLY